MDGTDQFEAELSEMFDDGEEPDPFWGTRRSDIIVAKKDEYSRSDRRNMTFSRASGAIYRALQRASGAIKRASGAL